MTHTLTQRMQSELFVEVFGGYVVGKGVFYSIDNFTYSV